MNDFKVRCIKAETDCFTVGNIYKVKGNNIMGNNAVPVSIIGCSCIEDINRTIASQFELVEESEPVESVVTEDEPKFTIDLSRPNLKIGDRIYVASIGKQGVLVDINYEAEDPYLVQFLRKDGWKDWSKWYSENYLTKLKDKSEPDYKTMFENCKKQLREAFDEIENLESKKVTPKLKSEPNYKELYEKAMDELQAMEEKNMPRDNCARIGDAVVKLLNIHKDEDDIKYSESTKEMLKSFEHGKEITSIMWSASLNDLSKIQTNKQICKLTSEIEKLTEINRSLVRSKVNNDDKIEQLKKCLKKQYKFIDKLLPERIEV